ncbi:MAG TPA: 3'(2'),5'-bisphosphate nucleotidase CysQ [Microthrixaceae bacterium]|nr:3'(2'),5'-bisphosphate nucleotidase CysQ [Microthrixaceae bacterium]HMU81475.1 3'(2'),5'-bisphosphate nucleotidase CysQ [Microthrixaceae bacterium]HMV74804.1 3'(2'),5'-bisphosphate nucleotidase CysQ [Microthrixaceae bacterium]HMX06037.1 3'(2'),5'-bisphosphate nucleotidase CysQ [Microthrixaceae bacterium]HMX66010.1 3'(2'),5'-bisphosphate nucleotidase CysQ [Microthrixaceae bacterium]
MATEDDHRLAHDLAREAGDLLLSMQRSATAADARELGARGDAAAHRLLVERLTVLRPEDAVLSEESTRSEREDPRRLGASRTWIIDPLDGTREYSEGRSDWAVHVALVEDHEPTAGAVALPARGMVLATDDPPSLPAAHQPPRVVVSRSRPPIEAGQMAEALGAELLPMGSAGAKAMAVVRGEAELYPHSGGQHEWDSCAPVAVASAAGLHCSRLDGSALRYNQPSTYLPDLLICRVELAEAALSAAGRQ